jgi:hypothetical protein
MSWRDRPLEVVPGRGIGPFALGQTKEEVQALTREPLESFFPKDFKVRSDAHPTLGVTVSYDDDGVANHIAASMRPRYGKSNVVFEGERLREATRGTLVTLLELLGAPMEDTGESIVVPSLGLKFGLREIDDEPAESDPCDYVVVEAKPE